MKYVRHLVESIGEAILYATLLATLTLFIYPKCASAQQTITVELDNVVKGGKHDDAQGGATVGDPNFQKDDTTFTSRGFTGRPASPGRAAKTKGSKITNGSQYTITDLHIKLINPDKNGNNYKFDPKSTGGGAFPDKKGAGIAKADESPEISPDGTEITFKGGNIKPDESFWSYIPLSSDFEGGKGSYKGRLTPTHEPEKTEKKPGD